MTKQAMGTSPKEEREKKLVGIVTILTGEKVAKLTLEDANKKFKNGTSSVKINLEDFPKVPRIKPNNKEPKQYRVRMSVDQMEVESVAPARGRGFECKLIDLGPRLNGKDSDPTPEEKSWEGGEPYLEFYAVYKVLEGPFKGVELPPLYGLKYKFEEDETNLGFARFKGDFNYKKATRLLQLRDWGIAHGIWEWDGTQVLAEPIPWDDLTILPTLLERILEEDRTVLIDIEKGYPKTVSPAEDVGYYDDDTEENPFGEEDVTQEDTRSAEVDAMLDAPIDIEETQDKIHSAGKSNGKVSKVTKPKKVTKHAKAKVAVTDSDDDL